MPMVKTMVNDPRLKDILDPDRKDGLDATASMLVKKWWELTTLEQQLGAQITQAEQQLGVMHRRMGEFAGGRRTLEEMLLAPTKPAKANTKK